MGGEKVAEDKDIGESRILAEINNLSMEISNLREKCLRIRQLMDEGTYKLNSTQNVLTKLKTKEQNIVNSAANQGTVRQMSEEQIDDMLEILKSPAFQNLAKQMMMKWFSQNSPNE